MKIAIVGVIGEGKSHFLNDILLPALLEQKDFGFNVQDGNVFRAERSGTPVLRVATFQDPEEAADWLTELP